MVDILVQYTEIPKFQLLVDIHLQLEVVSRHGVKKKKIKRRGLRKLKGKLRGYVGRKLVQKG
jgi:hypothetical protein